MDVLDRMEQSLQQLLSQTPELPPVPKADETFVSLPLDKLNRRLRQWQSSLDDVDRRAKDAEEMIALEQQRLRDYTKSLNRVQAAVERWCEKWAK
jgi:hypothetical protein